MKCVIDGEREALRDDSGQPWLTCGPCASRTRHALAEIPGLVAELAAGHHLTIDPTPDPQRAAQIAETGAWVARTTDDPDPVTGRLPSGPTGALRSSPRVSGSPSPSEPGDIAAVGLLAGARAGSVLVRDRSSWPEDQIGHLSVATELDFWVRDMAEVRGEGTPMPNVADLCAWLADRLDWACAGYPVIDEMAPALWRIRGALRAVLRLGDPGVEMLTAPCPGRECGLWEVLYPDTDSGYIACSACGTLLTESEYAQWARDLAEQHRVPASGVAKR